MSSGPSFEAPPVVEVVLGVHLPLVGLSVAHMARYWESIRSGQNNAFPTWTQEAPLPSIVETFGGPVPAVRVNFGKPPIARSMFEETNKTHLIQVQHDRFLYNWRKYGNPSVVYPRYPAVRKKFSQAFEHFARFLKAEADIEAVPRLCEVTYVNHIESGHGWEKHNELAKVFCSYGGELSDDFLPEPEGVDLNLRFVIPGADGSPTGRLHVAVRPVLRLTDGKELFRADLTARTIVGTKHELDSVLTAMDLGHDFLVNAFRSITTKTMHGIWGLQSD